MSNGVGLKGPALSLPRASQLAPEPLLMMPVQQLPCLTVLRRKAKSALHLQYLQAWKEGLASVSQLRSLTFSELSVQALVWLQLAPGSVKNWRLLLLSQNPVPEEVLY